MRLMRWLTFTLVVLMTLGPITKGRAQGIAAQPAQGEPARRQPSGWVGVVITTGIGQSNAAGSIVFHDYPVVESIDPASPAERAGLQAGDIIISLNSQDLRKNPIPMSSMLVPGNKIVFRYKRNDVMKRSTVTVAERPLGTSGHVALSIIGPVPRGSAERARREELIRTRMETVRGERPSGSLMPAVTVPLIIGPGSPTIGVAGAELTQLNDGLRDVLRFKGDGVFVINVAMGTPAGESGLKSGDVIVRVDREIVRTPGELIRLIHAATENSLLLHIMRKEKPHTIRLRW